MIDLDEQEKTLQCTNIIVCLFVFKLNMEQFSVNCFSRDRYPPFQSAIVSNNDNVTSYKYG